MGEVWRGGGEQLRGGRHRAQLMARLRGRGVTLCLVQFMCAQAWGRGGQRGIGHIRWLHCEARRARGEATGDTRAADVPKV